MHVEVNETNIALYELVKMTGNSKEELLKNAREAEESGYTLYCKIPDPEAPLEVNAFEHFDSEPAPKITIVRDRHSYELSEDGVTNVDFNIVDVVQGEVISDEEDES